MMTGPEPVQPTGAQMAEPPPGSTPPPRTPLVARVEAIERALQTLIGQHNSFAEDVSRELGL